MKLPAKNGKVDEAPSISMIRDAIDHGVNYIDTVYTCHEGTSEVVAGRALRNGYRYRIKRVASGESPWR